MELKNSYDLVVVGGGTGGFGAAVAAGRQGLDVLLIERYGFLGGMATASYVHPWFSFHTARGKKVMGGLVDDVVDRLKKYNASPGYVRNVPYGHTYSFTPFDVEYMKLVLLELAEEANVDLYLHTMVTDVIMKDNRIDKLRVFTKDGFKEVRSKLFVDATGDGDIMAAAGAKFEIGRKQDGFTQPLSHLFLVGGVNLEKVKEYVLEHPDQFVIAEDPALGGYNPDFIREHEVTAVGGFFDIVGKAIKEGRIPPNRDRLLFFVATRPGEVVINMARVVKKFSTNASDLIDAEIEGRKQIYRLVDFFKTDIPGFEDCYLVKTPPQIGPRESRRLVGEYVLTGEDVLAGKNFDDDIALGSYPVDIHDPIGSNIFHNQIKDGGSYGIPYRCLLPREVENLFVVGRPISTTHEAHGTTRLQMVCVATGQAAGTAAAIALKNNQSIKDINIDALQKNLMEQGVILHEED